MLTSGVSALLNERIHELGQLHGGKATTNNRHDDCTQSTPLLVHFLWRASSRLLRELVG